MLDFVIVGYGTVGKVTECLLGYNKFVTYDINPKSNADIIGGPIPFVKVGYFICTHEDHVPDAIKNIRKTNPEAFIIVRSTILPGFCDLYSEPKSPVIHMPAFHKETNSIDDFLNRVEILVIGTRDEKWADLIKEYIYLGHNFKSYIVTDPNTSALAKLVNNTRLALGVTFWNEIDNLATIFNADTKEIANVVCADRRHQRHGTKFFGKPWSGKCLPKDVDSLLKLINPDSEILLKAIKESNEKCLEYKKSLNSG